MSRNITLAQFYISYKKPIYIIDAAGSIKKQALLNDNMTQGVWLMRVTDHADYQYQGYENASEQNRLTEIRKADSCTQNRKQLSQQPSAAKQAFMRKTGSSLYSSTSDLMAIANTEDKEILRGIYVRLSFKLWSVRASGATGTDSKAISSATRSIQKVMGKVKGKIKGLRKEEEMEKKAKAAKKAKQRKLEQEIRRELAIKRRIRKNKERKDVEDSYLESDGQYSAKNYRDSLPEQVQVQLEMQAAGGSGTVALDTGMSVDAAIAMAGGASAMGVDAMTAVADVSGAIVDVAL